MRFASAIVSAAVVAAVCLPMTASAAGIGASNVGARDAWQPVSGVLPAKSGTRTPDLKLSAYKAFALNRAQMSSTLAAAPSESLVGGRKSLLSRGLVLTLPAPDGTFQRFAIQDSPVMEPGLAAKHPDINTYRGTGIDDPSATIRADLTPLGFHASVLHGKGGAWYIDPYYHLDQSVYVSYYARDLANSHGPLIESEGVPGSEQALQHAAASTGLTRNAASVAVGPDVYLHIYRLALVTDPSYATFNGGQTTAAKVTLMNRIDQIYEDEEDIRMVLVANNDLLNLDTYQQAIAPNGPCGAAGCFTLSQVSSCSTSRQNIVISQIIGAQNFDIGHLAMGVPGGGVANLGVPGRANKSGGCTGIPAPVGDYFAVDYTTHEMGHQFSMNHTFNGAVSNCGGGNRNSGTSVEPGSGGSIMSYAGICQSDDIQPHNDPYFSEMSRQENWAYINGSFPAINEIQTAALYHFGGGNEVQTVVFGPGYAPSYQALAGPMTIISVGTGSNGVPAGGANEFGNTVTINTTGNTWLSVGDSVTIAGVGVAGYNGTFTVTSVGNSYNRVGFTYTNPISGLAPSGGGTVTPPTFGATESGTTATITLTTPHAITVGTNVTVAGMGVSGYNGTWVVTAVPTPNSFQYTAASSGLANSGGGTVTFNQPFQVKIGANASATIGGSGLLLNATNIQTAINAISGFAGTVTVSSAGTTGFVATYSGASAALDLPNLAIDTLGGTWFNSVQETTHGGAFDSLQLNWNGALSVPLTLGSTYFGQSTIAGNTTGTIAASPTGATEVGNTVTITTTANHGLAVGETVTVAGVAVAGYNGSFLVTAVPSNTTFQYTNPTSGLAASGSGTVALVGATESGNTVTIQTTAAHGIGVGANVGISGVGVAGYNGTYTVTAVPNPNSNSVHRSHCRPRQLGRRDHRQQRPGGAAGPERDPDGGPHELHRRRQLVHPHVRR